MRLFGIRPSRIIKLLDSASSMQGDGAPNSDPGKGDEENMAEMGFLDHLEELRWTLFKGLGGILAITVVCAFFSTWIIDELLLGPAKSDFFMYQLLGIEAEPLQLQNRVLTGQFFVHIGIILSVGIVLGSPIFIYSLWKFIEPGLYRDEKSSLRFAAVFATFFFILGILFGYCIITPLAVQFFSNYQISDQIINDFDITKYFTMVTFWAFGTGVLFELPVIIYFLAKLGLVTPTSLRKARKYALLGCLVLGAFFTPPDPFSQILVAMPLLLLYEFSIFIAGRVNRFNERNIAKVPPEPSDPPELG